MQTPKDYWPADRGEMKLLTRDHILDAADLVFDFVDVPEWKKDGFDVVCVRTMTAGERDRWEAALFDDKGEAREENVRATLVALTVVREDGAPMFTEVDIAKLTNKSAAAMDRVFVVARKLNGLSAADVEELAKN